MSSAEFYQSESRRLYSTIKSLPGRCRRRIDSLVRQSIFRDSFYFVVAAVSLAVVIGWLSFVTIAARA